MTAALGPVAGIGVNVLRGIQDMSNGQFARGLEGMLPAAVRNGAKAVRYANEGAQDKAANEGMRQGLQGLRRLLGN